MPDPQQELAAILGRITWAARSHSPQDGRERREHVRT